LECGEFILPTTEKIKIKISTKGKNGKIHFYFFSTFEKNKMLKRKKRHAKCVPLFM
jgi:hypothetical protein